MTTVDENRYMKGINVGSDHIATLLRVAAKQNGCITWAQAMQLMTKAQFLHLIASGIVHKLWPSVYLTAQDKPSWTQRAGGLVLSIHGAALSHGAAARLVGLSYAASPALEITKTGSRRLQRTNAILHRSEQLDRFTTTIHNIHATKPERTIVDVSERFTWKQLGAIIDQARILKLTDAKSVDQCLNDMSTKGIPGVTNLRTALEPRLMTDHDIDSFLERRILGWIKKYRFPTPETQMWNRTCSRPYRQDIIYADRKIDIEPNGPHHLLPSIAAEDHKRDAELSIRGWLVIRVPLEMDERELTTLLSEAFRSRPDHCHLR